MIGHIESYDNEGQQGVIKAEDKTYTFGLDEWNPEVEPKVGKDVDFMPGDDGTASSVDIATAHLKNKKAVRNHYIAGVLGIVGGSMGLHRIYLGFYPIAVAQILLSFVLGFQYGFMWGLVEGILLFGKQINRDAKGRPLK